MYNITNDLFKSDLKNYIFDYFENRVCRKISGMQPVMLPLTGYQITAGTNQVYFGELIAGSTMDFENPFEIDPMSFKDVFSNYSIISLNAIRQVNGKIFIVASSSTYTYMFKFDLNMNIDKSFYFIPRSNTTYGFVGVEINSDSTFWLIESDGVNTRILKYTVNGMVSLTYTYVLGFVPSTGGVAGVYVYLAASGNNPVRRFTITTGVEDAVWSAAAAARNVYWVATIYEGVQVDTVGNLYFSTRNSSFTTQFDVATGAPTDLSNLGVNYSFVVGADDTISAFGSNGYVTVTSGNVVVASYSLATLGMTTVNAIYQGAKTDDMLLLDDSVNVVRGINYLDKGVYPVNVGLVSPSGYYIVSMMGQRVYLYSWSKKNAMVAYLKSGFAFPALDGSSRGYFSVAPNSLNLVCFSRCNYSAGASSGYFRGYLVNYA